MSCDMGQTFLETDLGAFIVEAGGDTQMTMM
jgi:hypothetical protein